MTKDVRFDMIIQTAKLMTKKLKDSQFCLLAGDSNQLGRRSGSLSKKERDHIYYLKNKIKHKETGRLYYLKNKEAVLKRSKKWAAENPEKQRAARLKWVKNNPDKVREISRRFIDKNPISVWATGCVQTHRKIGCEWQISPSELRDYAKRINPICPYCGCKMIFNQPGRGANKNSASLDRINNDKILNFDNIEIICHRCNVRKGQLNKDEFIEYCKKIAIKFKDFNKGETNANKGSI